MKYLNTSEILQNYINKKIIFFGAGHLSSRLQKKFEKDIQLFIVDNASNLWGTNQFELEIKNPNELKKIKKDNVLIIICSTAYGEISNQLNKFGFRELENYLISPDLNNIKVISDMESISKKLLFTSGSPRNSSPTYGGGVYEMIVDKDSWHYNKVFSGHSYGIIRKNEHFIFTDSNEGIVILDKDYNVIDKFQLPKGIRAHGIDYSEKFKIFTIRSELDGVLILGEN